MALSSGTRIGVYEIVEAIAAVDDDEALRLCGLRAEVAEQPHTGAAIDDLVARRREQTAPTAAQPALAPWPACQQGLDVPVP